MFTFIKLFFIIKYHFQAYFIQFCKIVYHLCNTNGDAGASGKCTHVGAIKWQSHAGDVRAKENTVYTHSFFLLEFISNIRNCSTAY